MLKQLARLTIVALVGTLGNTATPQKAVAQTYQIHQEIEQLFEQLRAIAQTEGTGEIPTREQPPPMMGGMMGGMGGVMGDMGGAGGMMGGMGGVGGMGLPLRGVPSPGSGGGESPADKPPAGEAPTGDTGDGLR